MNINLYLRRKKQVMFENKSKIETDVVAIKFLKQIKLPHEVSTCAAGYELPALMSTMSKTMRY